MNFRLVLTGAIGAYLSIVPLVWSAENHRVLILDALNEFQSPTSRLLVVEIESGKTVSQVELGDGPEIGLSPKGDVAAVITYYRLAGKLQPNARVETFRTSDLSRLEKGLLPVVPRGGFQSYPSIPSIAFSPDGTEIITQRMQTLLNDEKPVRYPVHTGLLDFLKRQVDQQEKFVMARNEIPIPRCKIAEFLSLVKWPTIYIWNFHLGAVEGVNVTTGTVASRLSLDYDEDPQLARVDPSYLEQSEIGQLYLHLGANGRVISGGSRYAYYLPKPTRNPEAEAGFIKKIDLGIDPPKVVSQSAKRQKDLWPDAACASDAAHAIFVAVQDPDRHLEPSGRIRIYTTDDLELVNEIQLSLPSCDSLTASADGKYAYALNRGQGKLAVIDVASGREIKILDKVGQYPAFVLTLPTAQSGK